MALLFPRRRRISDDWIGRLTFEDLLRYLAQYSPPDVQALRVIAEAKLREAVKGQGLAPIQHMPS